MRSLAALALTFALAVPAWATETGPPELLKDLGYPGTSPRDFRRLGGVLGGVAVFKGGANGSTLWRTDGTSPGTYPLLLDASLDTFFGADDGHQVYFLRSVGDVRELWRTDGSEAGTLSLTPGGLRFTQKLDRSDVRSPTQVVVPETGLYFFSATDGPDTTNYELWASDGTPGGTRLVKDINPQGPSYPNSFATLGGKAFFVAQGAEGHDFWGSDGTAAGTSKIKDLHPGDDGIVYVRRAGDGLILLAYHGSNAEIWTSDGTAAGTRLLKEIPGAVVTLLKPGPHLFFAVAYGLHPTELWSTDGTAAGTVAVVQDVPEPGDRNLYWESYVYPVGDRVFFRLWDPEHGMEPWASDGTSQGTGRIADVCPGTCNSEPSFDGTNGTRALFSATDGVSGDEPRIAEVRPGGGTWRLGDLCPGDCGSFSTLMSTETGWIVYVARASAGQELWVSDGNPDGAFQVSDFASEVWLPSFSGRSVVFGDRLIFGFQPVEEPGSLWSLTLPPFSGPPDPPPGDWITSPKLPGFRVKGRITAGSEVRSARSEPCIGETVCLSGAVPGRPELFVRVIGPRPNGYLWPNLVRFTTSRAEVWIEQAATGAVRYYLLEAVPRDSDELSGLVDRTGFQP